MKTVTATSDVARKPDIDQTQQSDAFDPLQTCLNDLGIQPGGGRIIFTNSLPGSYQLLLFSRRARLDTGIGQAM